MKNLMGRCEMDVSQRLKVLQHVCIPFQRHRPFIDPIRSRGISQRQCRPRSDRDLSRFVCRSTETPETVELSRVEHISESGKVLYADYGIAIVDDLDNDAPIGTSISFSNNACGALMWRREDNLCYILLLNGIPNKGDKASCIIIPSHKSNEAGEAPSQREFVQAEVFVGDDLFGQKIDVLGSEQGSDNEDSMERLPLLNQTVPVDDREQILEALSLGVKAVDILTPIGRGQAQLVTGLPNSGKTRLIMDSILGQKQTGVKCILASVGASAAESEDLWRYLQENGASEFTHMIVASKDTSLGEKYTALCQACSVGEQIRNSGGHSLVILDDMRSMVEMWENITEVVVRLRLDETLQNGSTPKSEENAADLVEYEGMLISAAAAQRRRFFSLLVQRAAKMHKRLGGGSMSLLLVLPGLPATGILQKAPDVSNYKHLSPELRAKLEAKLQGNQGLKPQRSSEAITRTEVVEEFMSMSDGQTVVNTSQHDSNKKLKEYSINASASVSRIGARAYSPCIRELAKSARLELIQAADAEQFSSNKSAEETVKAERRASNLESALVQIPGNPVPVIHQVVMLHALQSGAFASVNAENVLDTLRNYLNFLEQNKSGLLDRIKPLEPLTEELSSELQHSLEVFLAKQ